MYTAKIHNIMLWDASSYFSVKMTEIYVISTLNFKRCILFDYNESVFTVYLLLPDLCTCHVSIVTRLVHVHCTCIYSLLNEGVLQSIHCYCVMVSLCTFIFGIYIIYVKWIRMITSLPWLLPCCVR